MRSPVFIRKKCRNILSGFSRQSSRTLEWAEAYATGIKRVQDNHYNRVGWTRMPNLRQKTRSVWHTVSSSPSAVMTLLTAHLYTWEVRISASCHGLVSWASTVNYKPCTTRTYTWVVSRKLSKSYAAATATWWVGSSILFLFFYHCNLWLALKKIRRDMRAESADTKRFWDINMCWSGEYNWRCRLIAINKASYSNVFSGSDGNGPHRSTTTCYIWKIQLTMRYKERTC